jgi:hypothetical protein
MAIIYKKQELIDALKKQLDAGIENLYKAGCVNWTGITSDTKKLYTEEIAFELLHHIHDFESIPKITREASYYVPRAPKIVIDMESSRQEENFAKRIAGLRFESLGLILDYQVPIRNTRADEGYKAIDLISLNPNEESLYLIELKYLDNKETLLRAILEAFTYYSIVDIEKLKADYIQDPARDQISVVPALLLVHSPESPCNPYDEFYEMEYQNARPMLKALSLAMGIKVFTCSLDQIIEIG